MADASPAAQNGTSSTADKIGSGRFRGQSANSPGPAARPSGAAACAQAQIYLFGLWGDMPYQRNGDDPKIPALIRSMNQSNIAFSIYDGDIKGRRLQMHR